MARADLHVHSRFSHHASEWFLQRIGAAESYTTPEEVYRLARQRGMDFITLTDHNQYRGSLQLQEKYPERCFSGMEATAYFPEDGCKVHILLFGLAPSEFEKVHELRPDIYKLREYIRENRFAYSVSHGTYSVNGRLTLEHLEKLILLFDVFEGLNGGRNRMHNETWKRVLSSLTPETIERLRREHGIEPFSADPWVKGFTGGSDDHAGIFVGRGFTAAEAASPGELLDRIRDKHVSCEGRHNDFASFAFTVYKVAYDFSREKGGGLASSPLTRLGRIIFEGRKLSLVERIKLKALKVAGVRKPDRIGNLVAGLVEELRHPSTGDIERRLDVVYDRTTQIADEFFRSLLVSLEKDLGELDLARVIQSLSAALPGVFLTVPFFTAFNHMYQDRELIRELREKMLGEGRRGPGKVLWFTDTITDANGVAVTLRQAARQCAAQGRPVRLVTCLPEGEVPQDVPGVLNLTPLHGFSLPYHESLRLRVPSLLSALKAIYEEDPDEVIVSTPGPVGLTGVLAARLLNVRSVGIWHSDLGREAAALVQDESVTGLVDGYVDWFYGTFSEVRVGSAPYREILEGRGFPAARLELFRRGVDLARFAPPEKEPAGEKTVQLLYVGRVSRDKNLEFLLSVFDALGNKAGDLELTIVGDGPGLEELRRLRRQDSRIHFMGEVAHEKLPFHYRQADLFLFPSNTDTFGVAVAEAQACGVPCLVSDAGGTHTVIRDGLTGKVAAADDVADWVEKALALIRTRKQRPEEFSRMRRAARLWAQSQFSWSETLADLLGPMPEPRREKAPLEFPGLLEPASA